MARGQDSSRDASRQVGREAQSQRYLFGTVLGPQDSGERTLRNPAPVHGAFEGAPANAIRLAQMQYNHEIAMPALMQEDPDNNRKAEGLVDKGMGRLSDGRSHPVHTYFDERIKQR